MFRCMLRISEILVTLAGDPAMPAGGLRSCCCNPAVAVRKIITKVLIYKQVHIRDRDFFRFETSDEHINKPVNF